MAKIKEETIKTVVSPVIFKSKICRFEKYQMHYLDVPDEIFEKFGKKYQLRLLCNINEILTFHCAFMPLGNGSAFISFNKSRLKELKLKPGDTVGVKLEIDNNKYGMTMPEELKELLEQDEEGSFRFHKLTPGKQRNIIHFVSSVKNTQSRIEKAIRLIESLKTLPIGKETSRAMYELYKNI